MLAFFARNHNLIKKFDLNHVKTFTQHSSSIVFRQLFDNISFTYTYIVGDAKAREAIIIDPVFECFERDTRILNELNLKLKYAINTHVHADHVTSSGKLKSKDASLKSVISLASNAKADIKIKEGDKIYFGDQVLSCLYTPGHTDGCMSYADFKNKLVFTGDALLIRGCGRTDFQQGSSSRLYDSIHNKIFTLPEDFVVLPAHDYNGFTSSTIGEEKKNNPRLIQSKEEFIDTMKNLQLDLPKLIDLAVPANMCCGIQSELFKK